MENMAPIDNISPIPLGELFEMEDYIYSSEAVDKEGQSTPDGQGCDIPLPTLINQGADTEPLIREQQEEGSQAAIRAHMEDQMRYEREKRDHEIELMTMKKEMEEMRFKRERQQKLVDKITPWRDNDQPLSYLRRFKDTMTAAMIPPVEWHTRLVPLLSGRSLDAYSKYVPREATGNYPALKDALLKDALLKDSLLKDALLKDALLKDSLLKDALLKDALLKDALLKDALLKDALLKDALLNDALLKDALLKDALLKDALLKDALLKDALLKDALLKDALLKDALLKDALLNDALLKDALLKDALLKDALLKDALLKDALLKDALLKDALLKDALLKDALLKDALLKALGISKERCQREFWFYRKKQGDTAQDAARDVETMAERMAEGCSSVEEVVKLFSFNKFLSLFPQEDAEFVQLKKPASILEAANVMEEHIWRRGPSRDGYRKQNCFQGNIPPPQGNSYKPHRPTEMIRNGLEQKDYLSQSTPTDKPFNGGYGNKVTLTNTYPYMF